MSLRKRINNSSSYRVIVGGGSHDGGNSQHNITMDANSTLNKNISTMSYSKKSAGMQMPRKREYRLYSIK
jgi:hypothetical protein